MIPESINGKPVTIIGESAFYYCSNLTSVSIPDSVTTIGDSAFLYCGLTSVTIPGSVLDIGSRAFQSCARLAIVTIPGSVTNMGEYMFQDCTNLTSVVVSDSVTSIGSHAFLNCTKLSKAVIGSVASIESHVFSGCSSLTSVTISEGVTSIGGSVFNGCSKLSTVNIPEGVLIISSRLFYKCASLSELVIPQSVSHINLDAFSFSGLGIVKIMGNAPSVAGSILNSGLAFYRLPDANGWGSTLGTKPVYLWAAPEITQHPFSAVLNQGVSVTLSVTSTVPAPLEYQWLKNGFNIQGATLPTLQLQNLAESNEADYSVLVSTVAGGVMSEVARISVIIPPSITANPLDILASIGANAAFSVTYSGSESSFKWFKNGIELPGKTMATLEFDDIQVSDSGVYRVKITNQAGQDDSNTSTLTVVQEAVYTQAQYDASLTLVYNLGVGAVTGNPNIYGLYTPSQVQALNVGTSLLAKDPGTGKFKLNIKARKSTDLLNYADLDFSSGETTINPAGEIEFLFSSGDNAAFFRLETK